MANQDEIGKTIQQANTTPAQTIQSMIEKSAQELGKALPEHMRPERLVRIALTCIRLNPQLAECTPTSFLGALFTAAQLGIEPVGGRAYLLPFNNSRKIAGQWKTVKEVQFVMGYKGVIELFYRHEKSVMLRWSAVKENDLFEYQYGTTEYLNHVPAKSNRGKTVGYWALAELTGGGKPFLFMSIDECMDHARKHSKSYDKKEDQFSANSPWTTEADAMCLKTVFAQLAKTLPLSVEVQRALGADETSREYRKEIDAALDLPDTTSWGEDTPAAEAVEEVKVEEKKEPSQEVRKNEDPPLVNGAFKSSVEGLKAQITAEQYNGVLTAFNVSNEVEIPIAKRNSFLIHLNKLINAKNRAAK